MSEGKFNNIIAIMRNYSNELLDMANRMHEDAEKGRNEHIGKVANIIKILVGTIETPDDLDSFMAYCEIFASKQILDRLNSENMENIRDGLVNFYKNQNNNDGNIN